MSLQSCRPMTLALLMCTILFASARGAEPTGEIVLSPDTTRIVAGEGDRALAERVAGELEAAAGVRIPVVAAESVTEAQRAQHDFIALGNSYGNPFIFQMYIRFQAFIDAAFPGPGGHFVKTIVEPFGGGRSVILVGGSDAEGTERAAEKFLELARAAGGARLPALHAVESAALAIDPADPSKFPAELEANQRMFWESAGGGALGRATDYAMNYHFTNDPAWLEPYKATMMYFIDQARAKGDWFFAPRISWYFELGPMIDAWDLVESSESFTDADREKIRAAFYDMGVYLSTIPYLTEKGNPAGEPRQNHPTFASISLDTATRYFAKHGDARVEPWRAITDRIFAGQARTYRSDDDAGHYSWYAPMHTYMYWLRRDPSVIEREGFMRGVGKLALMLTDNRRDETTHGDVRTYSATGEGWPRYLGPVLSAAYAATREPAFAWGYRWVTGGATPPAGVQDATNAQLFAVPMPEDAKVPEELLGLAVLPVDDAVLGWVASRAWKPEWQPRQGVEYFDKLTLRPSFEVQDEYLLLDGISALAHGHEDANSIVRLTWKDRIWLADLDYIRATPRYHNGIEIAKDGQTQIQPPLTALAAGADFAGTALVATTLAAANGVDWTRHIAWRKGRSFVVIDRLVAREAGDYDLRSRWRVLGDARLEGERMVVSQPGAEMTLVNADDSALELTHDAPGQSEWDAYKHAKPGVTVLVERQRRRLAAGEAITFINLLAVEEPGAAGGYDVRALEDGLAAVVDPEGNYSIVGVAPETRQVGGMAIEATLFELEGRGLRAAGLRLLEGQQGRLESDVPVDLELGGGSGTLIVREPARVRLGGAAAIEGREGEIVALEAGEYKLRMGELTAPRAVGMLAAAARAFRDRPEVEAPVPYGIMPAWEHDLGSSVTAMTADTGGAINQPLLGLADGRIMTFSDSRGVKQFAKLAAEVRALAWMGEGADRLLVAGDSGAGVTALKLDGSVAWNVQLGRNRSRLEAVVAVEPLVVDGQPRVVVGTEGARIHCFDARGEKLWMEAFNYHAATQLAAADLDGDGRPEVVVGNEYSTPVDVYDADGKLRWETWEQVGSESRSTTPNLGTHAHALRVASLRPGEPPLIVVGTGTDEVLAVKADGSGVAWRTNVGGEVLALAVADVDGDGAMEVVAGTGSGYLTLLDTDGRRIWWRDMGGAVSALAVRKGEGPDLPAVIAVGTARGRVALLDPQGLSLGEAAGGAAVTHLVPAGEKDLLAALADGQLARLDWRPPKAAFGPQFRTGRQRY